MAGVGLPSYEKFNEGGPHSTHAKWVRQVPPLPYSRFHPMWFRNKIRWFFVYTYRLIDLGHLYVMSDKKFEEGGEGMEWCHQ